LASYSNSKAIPYIRNSSSVDCSCTCKLQVHLLLHSLHRNKNALQRIHTLVCESSKISSIESPMQSIKKSIDARFADYMYSAVLRYMFIDSLFALIGCKRLFIRSKFDFASFKMIGVRFPFICSRNPFASAAGTLDMPMMFFSSQLGNRLWQPSRAESFHRVVVAVSTLAHFGIHLQ
jgi:hypothetical protein